MLLPELGIDSMTCFQDNLKHMFGTWKLNQKRKVVCLLLGQVASKRPHLQRLQAFTDVAVSTAIRRTVSNSLPVCITIVLTHLCAL